MQQRAAALWAAVRREERAEQVARLQDIARGARQMLEHLGAEADCDADSIF